MRIMLTYYIVCHNLCSMEGLDNSCGFINVLHVTVTVAGGTISKSNAREYQVKLLDMLVRSFMLMVEVNVCSLN